MNLAPRIDSLDRNYFINGSMPYSQRIGNGQGSVSGGTSAYEFDRWRNDRNGSWSGSPTIERVSVTVPGQILLNQAMQMSGANDSGAGTAEHFVEQRIESIFAQDLAGKPVSFGYHYTESEFQEVEILFHGTTVKDDWASPNIFQIGSSVFKTLTNDSSWQSIVLENVVMPSTVDKGLRVQIKIRNAENTGVPITTQLTGFKLNIGEKLQNFSYAGRDLVEELILCQRYYEKSYELDVAPTTVTDVGANQQKSGSNNSFYTETRYQTRKRVTAVATIYDPTSGVAGNFRSNGGTAAGTLEKQGETGFGLINGNMGFNNNPCRWHWTADAEL